MKCRMCMLQSVCTRLILTAFITMSACGRCDDAVTSVCADQDASCRPIAGYLPGYTLFKPAHVATLPKKLKEASDVTVVATSEVALIQDEKGIIFLYDLKEDDVVRKIKFGPKGDYEGMAEVNDTMYVLRSNGTLFKVPNWRENNDATHQTLNLPTKDNEGLCYDAFANQLLIAPKSRWKKKLGGGKRKRPLFAVDLKTEQMKSEPAFVVTTKDILAFAKKKRLTVPGKINKKGEFKDRLRFMPAAVAVHPVTGEIYIVSSVDRTLISINRQQKITGFTMLDPQLFLQPEGIAFLPDGTLVVVNESPKKKPGLLLFKWNSGKTR
ncbi:MAG: hypothetical protein JXR76_17790 [Deltaproteobacteria bacterium]|nr:hypothetical protein [Deltaproteobacteria bacterium]